MEILRRYGEGKGRDVDCGNDSKVCECTSCLIILLCVSAILFHVTCVTSVCVRELLPVTEPRPDPESGRGAGSLGLISKTALIFIFLSS